MWVDPDGLNVLDSVIHESVHVWQYVCEAVGEDNPGAEHEAYTIAHIASTLLKEIKYAVYEERKAGLREGV